ncbi:MAG: sigma-70 family RNA polymerase sigma factor [Streptosporangiaceae bacterium]|jgi:RNA polymerase sigma factor (sigma-70 family)
MNEPERSESGRKLVADPKADQTHAPADGNVVESFSAFYRESLPGLVAFLMYQGATLADASDLAQEAMTDAFRSWDVIEYPKAWTRRVASRAFLRELSRAEDPVGDMPELGALLREGEVIDWEERHEVLRLMRLLPPRQRQVLAWYFDGFKPAEIAAELGLSSDVVRANLKKARRAIAAHLASREEDMR